MESSEVDKNKCLGATILIARFLKDCADPPKMPELSEFLKSLGQAEKNKLAAGVPGAVLRADGKFDLGPV